MAPRLSILVTPAPDLLSSSYIWDYSRPMSKADLGTSVPLFAFIPGLGRPRDSTRLRLGRSILARSNEVCLCHTMLRSAYDVL